MFDHLCTESPVRTYVGCHNSQGIGVGAVLKRILEQERRRRVMENIHILEIVTDVSAPNHNYRKVLPGNAAGCSKKCLTAK